MKPLFPEHWRVPKNPGYGTFPWPFSRPGMDGHSAANEALAALGWAISAGCRHLDTAFTYGNQEQVGSAIRQSKLSRHEFHIASKLHVNNNSYRDATIKLNEAIDLIFGIGFESQDKFLDSFFIHYPGKGDLSGAWQAILDAREKGLVRYLGVSNFEPWHLNRLRDVNGEYPEINQIEFHPWIFNQQKETLCFCLENGIAIEGYSPLAQGLRKSPLIVELANQYDTTSTRILLKWSMQHGVLPIVGSRNPDHLKSNFEPYDFSLSTNEMQLINDLGADQPLRVAEQWHWNSSKAPYGSNEMNSKGFLVQLLRNAKRKIKIALQI